MGRSRIFARMRPELGEALSHHQVLGDHVYALPRGPDAPYAPPPRGLLAVKLPEELGGPEKWRAPGAAAGSAASLLDTLLANQRVARRFPWLRGAAPPSYVLAYLRALGLRHRVPIAFYHLFERGDDLYYDLAVLFDAGAERVLLHATYLGADEPGRLLLDANGLDDAPGFQWVLGELWRALGARTGPAYFPPDDSSTFDWEAHRIRSLWPTVRETSLDRAVAIVRDIREWESDDETDRALFARLVGLDADELAGAADRARVTSLPVRSSHHLHFSPDSSQIAVLPLMQERAEIEIYRVRDGERIDSIEVLGDSPIWTDKASRHLGDAIVHLEWSEVPAPRRWRLVRHRLPGGAREVLLDEIEAHGIYLGAIPGAFIVVGPRCVWLGKSEGPAVERQALDLAPGETMSLLATEPASGRVAIAIDLTKELVVLDVRGDELEVVARKPLHGDDGYHAWFCGPETLLTFGRYRRLRSWRVFDGYFVEEASMQLPEQDIELGDHRLPLGITAVPSQGEIAVAVPHDAPTWYFARRLQPRLGDTEVPRGLATSRFPAWLSTDERYVVVIEAPNLVVLDMRWLELVRFAGARVAHLTDADFDRIAALLGRR